MVKSEVGEVKGVLINFNKMTIIIHCDFYIVATADELSISLLHATLYMAADL